MVKLIQLYVFILPWFSLGSASDDKVICSELFISLLSIMLIWSKKIYFPPVTKWIAIFITWLSILMLFEHSGYLGLVVFKKYVFGILLFFVIYNVCRKNIENGILLLKTLCISGAVFASYIIMWKTIPMPDNIFIFAYCKNIMALFLLICFPLAMLFKKAKYPLCALYITAITVSCCRGVLAITAAIVLVYLYKIVKRRYYPIIVLAVIGVCIIPDKAGLINWSKIEKELNVKNGIGRGSIWPTAIKEMSQHPFGAGIGRACFHNPKASYDMFSAHNIILESWGNIGIIGLLFLLFGLYKWYKIIRKTKDYNLFFASIFGALAYGLVEVSFNCEMCWFPFIMVLTVAYSYDKSKTIY